MPATDPQQETGLRERAERGAPLGIEGHRPHVPAGPGAPWCECGYRWNPRDPDSLLVGQHIEQVARELGVPTGTHPGWLC